MPDPTTTNRGFTIPNNGADVGAWDVPVNGNMNLLDTMLGAVATVSLSSANVTLSASSYQRGVISLSGTLVNDVTVSFPSVSGWWTVQNNCNSAAMAFVVKLSCGAGNVICAVPGGATDVYADGTNMNYRNLPAVGTYIQTPQNSIVPPWWTRCSVPPYLNCDGSTFVSGTYPMLFQLLSGNTLPDLRGRVFINLNQGTGRTENGINGDSQGAGGGLDSNALSQTNLPNVSYNLSGGGTFVTNVTAATNKLVNSVLGSAITFVTGITPFFGSVGGSIGPLGSGTAFTNIPPACVGGITMIRAA